MCIVSKVQSIKLFAPCGTLKVQRTITLHSLKIMESFDNRFTSQVDFNAKKTIDRSVIKPIIIDFCDDDSDDDTG